MTYLKELLETIRTPRGKVSAILVAVFLGLIAVALGVNQGFLLFAGEPLELNEITEKTENQDGTGLAVPRSLKVRYFATRVVALNWEDTSSGEEGFEVWRGDSPDRLTAIKRVPANYTSTFDVTAEEGRKYYYAVRAYRGEAFSGLSPILETVRE